MDNKSAASKANVRAPSVQRQDRFANAAKYMSYTWTGDNISGMTFFSMAFQSESHQHSGKTHDFKLCVSHTLFRHTRMPAAYTTSSAEGGAPAASGFFIILVFLAGLALALDALAGLFMGLDAELFSMEAGLFFGESSPSGSPWSQEVLLFGAPSGLNS